MYEVWRKLKTAKQWEVAIKYVLKHNDKALLKALYIVYKNQTSEELQERESKNRNGIGFNKLDAPMLTSMAHSVFGQNEVSEKDLQILRTKMPKYWRQIRSVAIDNLTKYDECNERNSRTEEQISMFGEYGSKNECDAGKSCSYGICSECNNS